MNPNPIRLPVFEIMRISWEKVKGSKGVFWSILLCIIVADVLATGIDSLIHTSSGELILNSGFVWGGVVAVFLLDILIYILEWGLVYIAVQRAMDLPIQFSMLKHVFNIGTILRMIGLMILVIIVLLPSIIFFFLPSLLMGLNDSSTIATNIHSIMKLFSAFCYIVGFILYVYLSFRMLLAPALVIVKKSNPWQAIKISFKATKSNVWRLIGLFIVNTLITIVSAIPFGIGLIWSIPYSLITYGMVYKNLVVSSQDLNI